jgi:hypothetical protein
MTFLSSMIILLILPLARLTNTVIRCASVVGEVTSKYKVQR